MRQTAVTVLTQLVLKDVLKVKGQVSEVAVLLIDPEPHIASLALNFFNELAGKVCTSRSRAVTGAKVIGKVFNYRHCRPSGQCHLQPAPRHHQSPVRSRERHELRGLQHHHEVSLAASQHRLFSNFLLLSRFCRRWVNVT